MKRKGAEHVEVTGIVTIPLSFLTLIVVSLLTRQRPDMTKNAE